MIHQLTWLHCFAMKNRKKSQKDDFFLSHMKKVISTRKKSQNEVKLENELYHQFFWQNDQLLRKIQQIDFV